MLPELGTYVYLASLRNIDKEFANEAKAYSTFDAKSTTTNMNKESISPLSAAFARLQSIASTQSQKEHQMIQSYLDKINRSLQNEELPEQLRNSLLRQAESLQKLDFENFQSNQLDLIKAINISVQNLDSYKRRLEQITKPVSMPKEFNTRFEFNIQTRLEEFFQHTWQKRARKREAVRDRKLNEMMDKVLSGFPKEIANEIKALLFIDFNNWTENIALEKISYTELTAQDIEPMFNEYLQQAQNELTSTHLQKMMKNLQEDFLSLVNDAKNMLHSTYLSAEEYKLLQEQVKKRQAEGSKSKIDFRDDKLTFKQAKDYITTYNKNLKDVDDKYVIGLHSKVSHGNFIEFTNTILKSSINIEGNVAGDLIVPIGTVTITKKDEDEQKQLMQLSRGLANILTEDFKNKQQLAIDDFDEGVKTERLLSDNMRQKMEEAKKNINSIDELNQKFFIAHETTKFYRGAEQTNSLFKDFHGRNMAAMSALTKLYASPELSSSMIDPHTLMLFLINISEATLAVNKEPLETYLSLFAGLLMFDDIKSLAEENIQEIQTTAQTSTVDAIHVYNIGGVYFPISVILNKMVEQMNNVINTMEIDASKTAVAEITGPTPEAPQHSTAGAWSALANSTMQGTHIQIHFLSGFVQYVSELFNSF